VRRALTLAFLVAQIACGPLGGEGYDAGAQIECCEWPDGGEVCGTGWQLHDLPDAGRDWPCVLELNTCAGGGYGTACTANPNQGPKPTPRDGG
jgi:hypothetical protein